MWEGPLGTVAIVGISTKDAILQCHGYAPLLGWDDQVNTKSLSHIPILIINTFSLGAGTSSTTTSFTTAMQETFRFLQTLQNIKSAKRLKLFWIVKVTALRLKRTTNFLESPSGIYHRRNCSQLSPPYMETLRSAWCIAALHLMGKDF